MILKQYAFIFKAFFKYIKKDFFFCMEQRSTNSVLKRYSKLRNIYIKEMRQYLFFQRQKKKRAHRRERKCIFRL